MDSVKNNMSCTDGFLWIVLSVSYYRKNYSAPCKKKFPEVLVLQLQLFYSFQIFLKWLILWRVLLTGCEHLCDPCLWKSSQLFSAVTCNSWNGFCCTTYTLNNLNLFRAQTNFDIAVGWWQRVCVVFCRFDLESQWECSVSWV